MTDPDEIFLTSFWCSPILEITLQDIEIDAIKILPFNVPLYFRYVDDIILAVPVDSYDTVLNIFNSFHKRIQFTIEIPDEDYINFLNIRIYKEKDTLVTDLCCKPTFSGRHLNYFSSHPVLHKKGIIIGFMDRIFKLSHPH